MFANLPSMLQHQDFQDRHFDLLAAARSGVVYSKGMKSELEILNEAMHRMSECALLVDAKRDAKIGAQLRIRLPKDYSVLHGPGLSFGW